MASATLHGVLKDGEAVVACDMPEPCMFLSLGSSLKRFLWTHKESDLAQHPVIGLVLQVGERRNFLRDLVSKAWILFFQSASRVHVSQ